MGVSMDIDETFDENRFDERDVIGTTHLQELYKFTCIYCLTSHHIATFNTAKVDIALTRCGHRFVKLRG